MTLEQKRTRYTFLRAIWNCLKPIEGVFLLVSLLWTKVGYITTSLKLKSYESSGSTHLPQRRPDHSFRWQGHSVRLFIYFTGWGFSRCLADQPSNESHQDRTVLFSVTEGPPRSKEKRVGMITFLFLSTMLQPTSQWLS